LNVTSTPKGSIKKRDGSVTWGDTTGFEVHSIFGVTAVTGPKVLIAAAGPYLYSFAANGALTATLGTTFTNGARWCFQQAPLSTLVTGQGPVYAMNGVDAPQQWNTLAGSVSPWTGQTGAGFYGMIPYVPNGKYMVYTGNRMFVAGVAGAPQTLYFSDFLDPSSFPVLNLIQFGIGDGQPITALGTVGPYLLVFKEHAIWAVNIANIDTSGVVVRKIDDNIGCTAHRSVVTTDLGAIFLTATRGIYATNGVTAHEIGYNIRPTILAANPSLRQNAAGAFFRDHYYLSFASAGATHNDTTLDYDISLKSWWKHDFPSNDWLMWEPSVGHQLQYAVAGTVPGIGFIAHAFVPGQVTDMGAPIPSFWRGPHHVFGYYIFRHFVATPFLKKRIRQVHFDGSGTITFAVWKDFASAGVNTPGVVGNTPEFMATSPINFAGGQTIFGNPDTTQLFGGATYLGHPMIFGGTKTVGEARMYALGTMNAISIEFGGTAPFEVDSYATMIQFRKS
jgi:hypothetical protein